MELPPGQVRAEQDGVAGAVEPAGRADPDADQFAVVPGRQLVDDGGDRVLGVGDRGARGGPARGRERSCRRARRRRRRPSCRRCRCRARRARPRSRRVTRCRSAARRRRVEGPALRRSARCPSVRRLAAGSAPRPGDRPRRTSAGPSRGGGEDVGERRGDLGPLAADHGGGLADGAPAAVAAVPARVAVGGRGRQALLQGLEEPRAWSIQSVPGFIGSFPQRPSRSAGQSRGSGRKLTSRRASAVPGSAAGRRSPRSAAGGRRAGSTGGAPRHGDTRSSTQRVSVDGVALGEGQRHGQLPGVLVPLRARDRGIRRPPAAPSRRAGRDGVGVVQRRRALGHPVHAVRRRERGQGRVLLGRPLRPPLPVPAPRQHPGEHRPGAQAVQPQRGRRRAQRDGGAGPRPARRGGRRVGGSASRSRRSSPSTTGTAASAASTGPRLAAPEPTAAVRTAPSARMPGRHAAGPATSAASPAARRAPAAASSGPASSDHEVGLGTGTAPRTGRAPRCPAAGRRELAGGRVSCGTDARRRRRPRRPQTLEGGLRIDDGRPRAPARSSSPATARAGGRAAASGAPSARRGLPRPPPGSRYRLPRDR